MRRLFQSLLVLVAILPGLCRGADVLELKNGQVLKGKYSGGTAGTIRFDSGSGVQVYETGAIVALTFGSGATSTPAAPASPTTATARGCSCAGKLRIVPGRNAVAGPMVDGASSDPNGKRFTTTLETDLRAGTVVAWRRARKVFSPSGGRRRRGGTRGKASWTLPDGARLGGPGRLHGGPYAQAGAKSGGKTARGGWRAIGAAADGGDGAAKGAATARLPRGRNGRERGPSSRHRDRIRRNKPSLSKSHPDLPAGCIDLPFRRGMRFLTFRRPSWRAFPAVSCARSHLRYSPVYRVTSARIVAGVTAMELTIRRARSSEDFTGATALRWRKWGDQLVELIRVCGYVFLA
jgi:hypothetical protein